MGVTVTTRVGEYLAEIIDRIAREEGMDRSTVIRRFLDQGARNWLIDRALERYESGSLTLWQAADECGLSLWEMVEEAKDREVRVPYKMDEMREDLRAL